MKQLKIVVIVYTSATSTETALHVSTDPLLLSARTHHSGQRATGNDCTQSPVFFSSLLKVSVPVALPERSLDDDVQQGMCGENKSPIA